MIHVIGLSLGEMILKGKNRKTFENKLKSNIEKITRDIKKIEIFSELGKIYIKVLEEDVNIVIDRVKKVFGIVYVSDALMTDRDLDSLKKASLKILENKLSNIYDGEKISFKVFCNRADKSYNKNSPEIAREVGAFLLKNLGDKLKVDVNNPEISVRLEIRQNFFVSVDRYNGVGGLPGGSGGKGLLLLSGGIDSPVAGYEIARRGVAVAAIHFHSYPFTSERAFDKSKRLAKQMSLYTGDIKFFSVNLLEVYKSINEHCKPKNMTIISRRFMMRIANVISKKYGYDALVTGESLGQVASQTIQGISVINNSSELPILRPLISRDKTEIMNIAKELETYDISIEPYDDCCSIFAPTRPNTKPRLSDILKEEEKLDIDNLINLALDTMTIEDIKY